MVLPTICSASVLCSTCARKVLHTSCSTSAFFQNGPVYDPQCRCHEINRLNICFVSRRKSKGQKHLFDHLCKCREGQNTCLGESCDPITCSTKRFKTKDILREGRRRKMCCVSINMSKNRIFNRKCAASAHHHPKIVSRRSCRRAVPVVQDLRDPSLTFRSCSDHEKQTAMSKCVSCLRCLYLSASDVLPRGRTELLEVEVFVTKRRVSARLQGRVP